MMIKEKRKFVFCLLGMLCMGVFFITGCAMEAAVADTSNGVSQAQNEVKTDISEQKADEAAEGIREQAQLALSSAELAYVYAYPEMVKTYGSEINTMDVEIYFLRFAKMMQSDAILVPKDDEVLEAITSLGIDAEAGTFSMDNFSAGMSAELGEVPGKMQEMIKNYDSAAQGKNQYLEAAHAAYQG